MTPVQQFLSDKHPVYTRRKDEWETAEKVYRGGKRLREMLQPFYWEDVTESGKTHLALRKSMATAINYPQRMTERFTGHLAAAAPSPEKGLDFGTLGKVRPLEAIEGDLSRAELMYYNCDRRRSAWPQWWNNAQKWSMVYGHMWIGNEIPTWAGTGEPSRADEQKGHRPYLVQYSPLEVPNWHYDGGRLAALVIVTEERDLSKSASEMQKRNLLYVASGFTELGEEYSSGGWWLFDDKHNVVKDANGQERTGDLEDTGGEIPYTPFFFAYDDKDFSVSGIGELSQTTISYMNLASAGNNDAIEGGGRTMYILGGSKAAFNTAADVVQQGGRMIPLEASLVGQHAVSPEIYDSASASASTAIDTAIERTRKEADVIAADMLQYGPQTSGEARLFEFTDVKAPRLAHMAHYREQAENFHLTMTGLRFGEKSPNARTVWPKKFDVSDAAADWGVIFDNATKAMLESPTLFYEGIKQMAAERGIQMDDAIWTKIEAEIRGAFDRKAQAEDALLGDPSSEPVTAE